MGRITLDDAGSIGLIKDIKVNALPVEAWNVLLNVRCKDTAIQSLGTDLTVYDNGSESPRFFFNMRVEGDQHWIVASNGKAYKVNGSNHTDITKVATTYSGGDSSIWCGFDFHLHQILNVNSGSDLPQVLTPGASNFVDLTNWPASTYCVFMNAYKNFLIAYNITEGASAFPNRVKWSDLADTGALPASWDETDLTTLAGENDELERGGGQIFCARILNDVNYIYKNNSVWYMYPRNDLRVFNFKEMETDNGIMGPHAITTFAKRHFLVIAGDVVTNDGQRLQTIIHGRLRNWLFDNMSETYFAKTVVVPNYRHKEIWICFPDTASTGWLNRALVYNVAENTWAERELNDFSYLASGIIDTSGISQIIDDDSGIIDNDDSIIDSIEYNPSRESILAGDPTNSGYFQLDTLESGILSGASFERHGLTIAGRDRRNDWVFSARDLKQITRLYPKFTGAGSFYVYVGVSKTPDGAITWEGPQTYTIGSTPHVDFLNSMGEAISLRFEPQGNQAWTYIGCDLEMTLVGEANI